ncbi:TPA: hypothetical protein HA278_06780 [Candidatus Woesearchaeota archaeon]|nr:hypothetical protein [archaeon]HIJ11737.1 hypothetical protein [Candidatus Woesearchaeota archaeon]|tara:strand:+ start:133 stop:465 length:333 start_codon:yes stop_codon:yes gene_type:complete
MKYGKFGVVLLLVLLAVPLALAGPEDFRVNEGDVEGIDGMEEVTGKLANIIGIVQYMAVGIAVLFASITGIQFMGARDPVEKKRLGDRLKYVLLGLAIVVLSFPLVRLVL